MRWSRNIAFQVSSGNKVKVARLLDMFKHNQENSPAGHGNRTARLPMVVEWRFTCSHPALHLLPMQLYKSLAALQLKYM